MPYELYREENDPDVLYVKVIDTDSDGRRWIFFKVGPVSRELALRNKIGQAHLWPGMSRDKLDKVLALPTLEEQVKVLYGIAQKTG